MDLCVWAHVRLQVSECECDDVVWMRVGGLMGLRVSENKNKKKLVCLFQAKLDRKNSAHLHREYF